MDDESVEYYWIDWEVGGQYSNGLWKISRRVGVGMVGL